MFKFFKKEKTKFGEPILLCPRCKKGMDKIKKHGIIIDVCRKCGGLWLDDKEIDKIVEAQNKFNIRKKNKKISEGEKK